MLLIGDSIIHGLARYPKVWNQYFSPLKTLNFGVSGDKTQHVLWRAKNGEIPLSTQSVVIHVRTNNIGRDEPKDIADGISSIAMLLHETIPNAKIILTGLLPRGLKPSFRRVQVAKVNGYLEMLCANRDFRNFYYLKPDKDYVLPNGFLDTSYYYHDNLHLIEKGYKKFSKSIFDVLPHQPSPSTSAHHLSFKQLSHRHLPAVGYHHLSNTPLIQSSPLLTSPPLPTSLHQPLSPPPYQHQPPPPPSTHLPPIYYHQCHRPRHTTAKPLSPLPPSLHSPPRLQPQWVGR